ncbi:hypothetical protein [Saccharicrinis fermentans]|uniref:Nucleotidyltransferase n=1 Tax=Saccharicrinis fermentans DSM 9555 = JCM 21142 TaxID=869213 RepID=W7YU85_9BACT|nr:hypothetical protein [Saccharicrinis fermentans]GAF06019.1 hypothetical protein JCM21142_134786 [Saccharicrinis fermentans DSM 9555 = JCM 21142]
MARNITEIQQGIIDNVQSDEALSEVLTSESKTALWRLFSYIFAVASYLLEVLFDKHTDEIDAKLATQKTHNETWYAEKAKQFQYGYELVTETDYYENEDEDAKIISHAAVESKNGTLFMKVAKNENGELQALSTSSPDELTPFTAYITAVKDAGVVINVVSSIGDNLRLVMDIYYDPQVLNADGTLITDPSQSPAEDTIRKFIRTLPFNGEFIPASLVDSLQEAPGIDIPEILSVETKYADNDWQAVQGKVVPNAGYLTVTDDDLTLNYKANV